MLLVAILGLALLIMVHELGHFLVAKLFGMRVEKFYIGFPPAAWKRRRGETEYGVGLIPLGGFCKISGMSEAEKLPDEVKPRAYYAQPVWKRNLVIFAGPFMNFVAAVLIVFVFLLAQGTVQPTLRVAQVVRTLSVKGAEVQTPAAKAGLTPGITLVGADGGRWTDWAQASSYFQSHLGRTFQLTYLTASGQARTVAVTPAASPDEAGKGFLGVRADVTHQRPAPWRAGWMAVTGSADIFVKTFQGLWQVVTGKIDPAGSDGATGVVGIVSISQQAVRQSWYPVLLAFLSINLGIINLFPILPFDGGHIFFNTVESVRGRKVDRRTLERFVAVGTTLLVALFVYLTFNDIKRLFGS